MAKNPEALDFSKNYLEPEVANELKNFFENKFNIRLATFKEDTQDKIDIVLNNNVESQFDFLNKYLGSEIGINVKTIELKNNKGKQSNFTLPSSEVESLNRCSFYMFCLPERFTETRFCKYECYFCSKEDVLKYYLPKYPEFYLVPFSIISKIFKFKIILDLSNKK